MHLEGGKNIKLKGSSFFPDSLAPFSHRFKVVTKLWPLKGPRHFKKYSQGHVTPHFEGTIG